MVLSYPEAIRDVGSVGKRVAVLGAGGTGVDVSELLTHLGSPSLDLAAWQREWGVTDPEEARGAVRRPSLSLPSGWSTYFSARAIGWAHGWEDHRMDPPRGAFGEKRPPYCGSGLREDRR